MERFDALLDVSMVPTHNGKVIRHAASRYFQQLQLCVVPLSRSARSPEGGKM